MEFNQTWWNENAKNKLGTFMSWVGDHNASTKVYSRNYIYNKKFESIVDLGCATCTMYDGFKKEGFDIEYTGVDSCEHFIELSRAKGVNCVCSDVRKTPFLDSSFDMVYSRHIIEHQPEFKNYMDETIRLSKKEVLHIFFKNPGETETISYSSDDNLFHNTYKKEDIEDYLRNHKKIKEFFWVMLNKDEECALHIINN